MGKFDESHELGNFLRIANDCCNQALEQLKDPLMFLGAIDSLYVDFIQHAGGIKPSAASILILNSHASFRAAIGLGCSGQLLPVFMTLRGSIESALYANAMVNNPELQTIWLKRDSGKEARQACRDEFTAGKIFRALAKAQNEEFSNRLREIYDSTIDFGAHPNSRLLLMSTQLEKLATGEHKLNFTYIHGDGSFELRRSLVACAEIGLAVFFVTLICYETHPGVETLNMRALELQDHVPKFIEQLDLSESERTE